MASFGGKITLFGDSITRLSMDPENGCWASYLANQLISYYTVDVKGFSGYTTKWALQLLPKVFNKQYLRDCDFFIIFFGHNDAWQASAPLAVSPSQFKDNLLIMIKLLLEDGMVNERIMLISPGWFDEPTWLKWQLENLNMDISKTFDHCRLYAEACAQVSQETGVCLVDWWKVTTNYKPLGELFSDGLHLSKIGAKLLFDTIWPELKASLEKKHGKAIELLTCVEPPKELVELMNSANASLTEEEKRRLALH